MLYSLIRPVLASALALPFAFANAEITFDSSFESGNGTDFEFVDENTVEFRIERDTKSRDNQWYYFGVHGAEGRTLTFRILDTNQTNVRSHWRAAWPVASTDEGDTWTHVEGPTDHDETTFTFSHTFMSDNERIAFHYPYTWTMAQRKIAEWEQHPHATRETIGESVEGRPIEYLLVTDDSVPDEDKLGFWVISRQHSAETTASFSIESFIDFLLSDDETAVALRQRSIMHLVPMVNPDGVVAGNYRNNAEGVNLNRVWDGSATMETAPEIVAVLGRIDQWVEDGNDFSMFIDFHSTAAPLPHFAFHPGPGIEPPLYHTPSEYNNDLRRYLALVNDHAPEFDNSRGASQSVDNTSLSYHSLRNRYGVLGMIPEGTYTRQFHGPNPDDFMTIDVHYRVGVAFAKALADFFELHPESIESTEAEAAAVSE